MNRVSIKTETVEIDDAFAASHGIKPEYRKVWGRTAEISKALYANGSGDFAKVHAVRLPLGFGEIGWRMTGSHCDADGKAIAAANGHKIHAEPHVVKIASNSAEDVSERFNAGLEHVARRVMTAVAHEAFTPPTR